MDVEPKDDLIPLVIPLALSFITHFGVNGFLVASMVVPYLTAINGTYISIFPTLHLINGVKVDLGRKRRSK